MIDYAYQYLKIIREYHDIMINCITPSDYKVLQSEFGYTASYEEHMTLLTETIPDDEQTIKDIETFLEQYTIFNDDMYIDILLKLNKEISYDLDKLKLRAFTLMKAINEEEDEENVEDNEDDDEDNDEDDDEEEEEEDEVDNQYIKDRNDRNGIVRVMIEGTKFELQTNNNPLLSHLYCLLLTSFSIVEYGKMAIHV